ncbi:MAG: hypothetical protein AAF721_39595 [Myxococcota bacterium]
MAIAFALGAPMGEWLDVQCPEVDAPSLLEFVAIELPDPPADTRATLRCDANAYVVTVMHKDGRARRRTIDRTAAIGEVPERYLALELSELVPAIETVPAPKAKPPPPQPKPKTQRRRRGFGLASGRAEVGGAPAMLGGGGQLSLGGRVLRRLTLRADVIAMGGRRVLGGDLVRTGALWSAASALATFDAGRTVLLAGAGARLGGLWIRGIPRREGIDGRLHGGLSWSPQVSFAVLASVGRASFVGAGLDAGWTMRPVRGFSESALVYASRGPWVALSFGVGGWFGR